MGGDGERAECPETERRTVGYTRVLRHASSWWTDVIAPSHAMDRFSPPSQPTGPGCCGPAALPTDPEGSGKPSGSSLDRRPALRRGGRVVLKAQQPQGCQRSLLPAGLSCVLCVPQTNQVAEQSGVGKVHLGRFPRRGPTSLKLSSWALRAARACRNVWKRSDMANSSVAYLQLHRKIARSAGFIKAAP